MKPGADEHGVRHASSRPERNRTGGWTLEDARPPSVSCRATGIGRLRYDTRLRSAHTVKAFDFFISTQVIPARNPSTAASRSVS